MIGDIIINQIAEWIASYSPAFPAPQFIVTCIYCFVFLTVILLLIKHFKYTAFSQLTMLALGIMFLVFDRVISSDIFVFILVGAVLGLLMEGIFGGEK